MALFVIDFYDFFDIIKNIKYALAYNNFVVAYLYRRAA